MSKIKTVITSFFSDLKTYWKVPRPGEYVSNKEFLWFCVGASGSNSAAAVLTYITFTASCFLVGAIYGISFDDIYKISLIGLPFSYIWNFANMMVTDNLGELPDKSYRTFKIIFIPLFFVGMGLFFVPQTLTEKFMPALPQIVGGIICVNVFNIFYRIFVLKKLAPKYGKYRPWIIVGVFPTIAAYMLIVYLPFTSMPYHTRLWVLNLLFCIASVFSSFCGQLGNLQNVLSPNSDERVRMMSIGAIVYSAFPSLVNILLPIFAGTGGMNNIKTYRVIIPIMLIAFSLLTLTLFFGTREKVIVAKSHKPSISFWVGTKSVLKNKYHWIVNLSSAGNAITTGSIVLANIIFVYSMREDWLMGIYSGIIGTAYVPGMLIASYLIKKFDKRNLVLFSKLISLLSLAAQYYSLRVNNVVLFIIFSYITTLLSTPSSIAATAMGADIWDYQQYLTGERLDGFAGIFSMLLTPVTTLAAMLIPFLYSEVGFTSDWDILYESAIRNEVINITILVAAAAVVLTAIPYFFYDLSIDKHRRIIEELKVRAEKEDQANAQAAEAESGKELQYQS